MRLERYAKRVTETYGLLHSTNLRLLRLYIKRTPEEELVEQVKDIKEAVLLRILWEAGLSARLQEVVLERLKKLS